MVEEVKQLHNLQNRMVEKLEQVETTMVCNDHTMQRDLTKQALILEGLSRSMAEAECNQQKHQQSADDQMMLCYSDLGKQQARVLALEISNKKLQDKVIELETSNKNLQDKLMALDEKVATLFAERYLAP